MQKRIMYDGEADAQVIAPDGKSINIGPVKLYLKSENITLEIALFQKGVLGGRFARYHIEITEREP